MGCAYHYFLEENAKFEAVKCRRCSIQL